MTIEQNTTLKTCQGPFFKRLLFGHGTQKAQGRKAELAATLHTDGNDGKRVGKKHESERTSAPGTMGRTSKVPRKRGLLVGSSRRSVQMTRHRVLGLGLSRCGRYGAAFVHGHGATRMKSATRWGIDGGGNLSGQHDLLAFDVGMGR